MLPKLVIKRIDYLPKVSVVIPTRGRPRNLVNLLLTILNQSRPPFEVTIIDDSIVGSSKNVAICLRSEFESAGCELKYVVGSNEGLPAARILGVDVSEGEFVLFLDDDTLLDRNVVCALGTFLRDNPVAVGVQPKISSPAENVNRNKLAKKFRNAFHKSLMLSYYTKNKRALRRSGVGMFANNPTEVMSVQILSGCCCCYRREVFNESSFDTNLKRWGFMEDLDFSYRVYMKNPGSLYAIPHAKIVHNSSEEARLPTKQRIYMTTIYWSYLFFKNIFKGSILNLIAFLWALIGNLVVNVGGPIAHRKPKREWWSLVFLLGSYATAFKNLRNILMQRLEFFNKNLE